MVTGKIKLMNGRVRQSRIGQMMSMHKGLVNRQRRKAASFEKS
jgi:hypothetical protein